MHLSRPGELLGSDATAEDEGAAARWPRPPPRGGGSSLERGMKLGVQTGVAALLGWDRTSGGSRRPHAVMERAATTLNSVTILG
jgi:hypothetical protein